MITPEKRSVTCKSKTRSRSMNNTTTIISGYKFNPIPLNGQFFTPIDAMNWLVLPVCKTTINGKIKSMIRLKYVPIGESRLYTMYKHFLQTGLCSKVWHLKGRRPMLTVADCFDVHHQSTGRAVTGSDINTILIKSRRDAAMTHGVDPSPNLFIEEQFETIVC